jgi:uncharacterized protein with HEPN domain
VSSESPAKGGRSSDEAGALAAALRVGQKALDLTASDDEASYLANEERQFAIERLLIRFGEALKDVSPETLTKIDPHANWSGPKGFRDLASHWYDDGLDHGLIWSALQGDLPTMLHAIKAWLSRPGEPSQDDAR